MKAESGPVTKTYTEETTNEENKFVVRGDTHEEKLKGLVETVLAHRLMLAITIGDVHLNSLTYGQASQKYEFSKSRIQRAISGKAEHKKGGKQYYQEQKWKTSGDVPVEAKKDKPDNEVPTPALFPTVQSPQQQDTLPDLVNDNDDQFPKVNIDA